MTASLHISTHVDRPATEVYDYTSNPVNLPEWAAGLGGSITQENGQWVANSPFGHIVIEFVERNSLGVLDHYVTVESGERFYNPMRVIADGSGCEVVFTLRRAPGVDDDAFAADRAQIEADLATLKSILDQPSRP